MRQLIDGIIKGQPLDEINQIMTSSILSQQTSLSIQIRILKVEADLSINQMAKVSLVINWNILSRRMIVKIAPNALASKDRIWMWLWHPRILQTPWIKAQNSLKHWRNKSIKTLWLAQHKAGNTCIPICTMSNHLSTNKSSLLTPNCH